MRFTLLLMAFVLTTRPAAAQSPVAWADWLVGRAGTQQGVAAGQFVIDGRAIDVNYNGPLLGVDGTDRGSNTQYWVPASTYTSASVPNAPPGADLLAFNAPGAGLLSFREPVAGLTLAFLDLEQAGYEFDTDFTILSQGPGIYGNGTLTKVMAADGKYQLNGTGSANGTIRFAGQFTSLSITSLSGEAGAAGFDGFTLGVTDLAPVPEPAGPLAAAGLLTLLYRARKTMRTSPAGGAS